MSLSSRLAMNRTFTPELEAGVLTRLAEYAARFAPGFHHPRQRAWCGVYLAGLLQDGERHERPRPGLAAVRQRERLG